VGCGGGGGGLGWEGKEKTLGTQPKGGGELDLTLGRARKTITNTPQTPLEIRTERLRNIKTRGTKISSQAKRRECRQKFWGVENTVDTIDIDKKTEMINEISMLAYC